MKRTQNIVVNHNFTKSLVNPQQTYDYHNHKVISLIEKQKRSKLKTQNSPTII